MAYLLSVVSFGPSGCLVGGDSCRMDFLNNRSRVQRAMRSPSSINLVCRVKQTEAPLRSNFSRNRPVDRAAKVLVGRRQRLCRRPFKTPPAAPFGDGNRAFENPETPKILNPDQIHGIAGWTKKKQERRDA